MLKFIKDLGMRKEGNTTRRWCVAECPYCTKVKECRTCDLKNRQSCGCATHLKAHVKHGMSNTRQYTTWADLKDRCDNPNNKSYVRYGARGISYDPKWKTFEGFWEDMAEGYFDTGTIERKNNNLGYDKANCTWITIEDQVLNRSKINTFKQRETASYLRKITMPDIIPFGERYKNAPYGKGKEIKEELAATFSISIHTAAIYLSRYKKGTLCKLL